MAINYPEGTQDFPAGIVQVKPYMTNGVTSISSSGYIWGGGNNGASAVNGRITITPRDTSNRIMVVANLFFGKCNLNGGCKVLINGSDDTTTRWLAYASGAYQGGVTAYRQAWSTSDDSFSIDYSDYAIGSESIIMTTTSSYTLPSSIDIGFYWYENNNGHIQFNRQNVDNGGRAVSSCIIYEVDD